MHICPTCPDQVPMVSDGGVARCPRCGSEERPARVDPLYLVTGASGAGKTTVFPLLLERLAGEAVVVDVDWLIDPIRRAGSDGVIDWDVFRDVWLHVAHGVAQNALAPVLLGPFFAEQLEQLPGRAWVGQIHILALDCPDEERRRRIEARPAWRARDIDEQIAFGRWLREHVATVVDTSSLSPEAAADAVAAWVRRSRTSP